MRDFLEAVDAADVLLESGAVGAARAIGRICIEQGALILYLLRRNDERIAATKYLSDLTAMGESLAELQRGVEVEGLDALAEAIRAARIQFAHHEYATLEADNELRRISDGPSVPWYAVFEGPGSVGALLSEVGFHELYDRFYRPWSAQVHGAVNSNTVVSEADYPVRPLRFYSKADDLVVGGFLAAWCSAVTMSATAYFFPNDSAGNDLEDMISLVRKMPADPVLPTWTIDWEREHQED